MELFVAIEGDPSPTRRRQEDDVSHLILGDDCSVSIRWISTEFDLIVPTDLRKGQSLLDGVLMVFTYRVALPLLVLVEGCAEASLQIEDLIDRGEVEAELIQLYNVGRQPRGPTITIYLPVSRYDEFAPSPLVLATTRPVSSKDLLESIWNAFLPPRSRPTFRRIQTSMNFFETSATRLSAM